MIEQIIAIICFIYFIFTKEIEVLKICGIFSIASYIGQMLEILKGEDTND